jgi:hypothetical protein
MMRSASLWRLAHAILENSARTMSRNFILEITLLAGLGRQHKAATRRSKMPKGKKMLPEDEMTAKLRSLLEVLESQSGSRPVNARNQQQRLGKIRAAITNLVNKEARKICCCRVITVGYGNNPEEFEAEMKRLCAIHGRRNLGHIVTFTCTTPDQEDLRLLELVRQYRQG